MGASPEVALEAELTQPREKRHRQTSRPQRAAPATKDWAPSPVQGLSIGTLSRGFTGRVAQLCQCRGVRRETCRMCSMGKFRGRDSAQKGPGPHHVPVLPPSHNGPQP